MCNMDNENNNMDNGYEFDNDNDFGNNDMDNGCFGCYGLGCKDNRKKMKFECKDSNKMDVVISQVYMYDKMAHSYKFKKEADSNIYYVNLRRKTIQNCTKEYIKRKYYDHNNLMKTVQRRDLLIVIDKSDWYQPQAFPHIERMFTMLYDKGKDAGSKIVGLFSVFKTITDKVKGVYKIFGNIDWAKLTDIVISIFFSASTALVGIIGVLQFLYNIFKLVKFVDTTMKDSDGVFEEVEYQPQSMSLEALMAGFSLMGIPSWLMDKFRNFALLTGVKVHASHSFSTLFAKIRDLLTSVLKYIFSFGIFKSFEGVASSLISVVEYIFTPFSFYDDIMKVAEQYTQFVKDNSVLHNPVFREEVTKLYGRLKVDNGFLDYVRNNDNRHFTVTWNAYKDNLIKFVDTYATSARDEPICIVFDGPPGCGKSVLMNRFVEMLKTHNKSVYTHTVPPVDASKDFYDDYMNQNVFVMDDVGQQGKSQWRTIINFVAPVKYPLDCAQADKKNTKFFQSEVIICTTNNFKHLNGFTAKDGISCPEALFRRVHLISVSRDTDASYFKQRLCYSKYDENFNVWRDSFIGPNKVATKFSSSGQISGIIDFPYSIETPREGGLKASLGWLFMLYNHLTESNKMDRMMTNGLFEHVETINEIMEQPENVLGNLRNFRPQFFESIYDTMNGAWSNIMNGANIFKEYVLYLTTTTEELFKKIISGLIRRVIKPLIDKILNVNIKELGEDVVAIIRGAYIFVYNLVLGDYVEKAEGNVRHDHCYACMESYDNMGDIENGRPLHVPIAIRSCGHSMCATCAVLLRDANRDIINVCGVCRNIEKHQEAYYIGENRVEFNVVFNYVKTGRAVVAKKCYDVVDVLIDTIASVLSVHPHLIASLLWTVMIHTLIFFYFRALLGAYKPQVSCSGVFSWIFGSKSTYDATYAQFEDSKKRANELLSGVTFNTTSAEAFKKNQCRIMVNTKTGVHSSIIVSGKRFITNSHVDPEGIVVDVYQSYDHVREQHKEMESVRVKVISNFITSDVCVCEFVDVIPFYKVFNRFGGTDVNKFSASMFVSPYGIVPLVPGVNIGKNKEKIVYKYKVRADTRVVEHLPDTGFTYGVQGLGLCGSAVYDSDRVVGIHVTGNGKEGFAQIFPSWMCEELNKLMFSKPTRGDFETRTDVIPNFSGVRLTYGQGEKWANFGAANIKTSFLPSTLHISTNDSTAKLYSTIRELQDQDEIAPIEVELKQPPRFGESRTKVKENMVKIARKSFKHQGIVTEEEMDYVKSCLRAILPMEIRELTDEETSFGGKNVKSFKKDTSNGFACLKGKESYLDFQNKKLTPEGIEVLTRFRNNAKNVIFDEDDFVCKETFKDELRAESKIDKPRLFRVMPFPHIWWSKKLFGELIPWFKEHLHDFGVCVGFNPYTDFDPMVKKLKGVPIHGDEDYSQWDGSLLALMLLTVRDVLKEIYVGENEDVLDYVMVTIARSWTMIADELYASTHSLPSGTWMTLLLNCLINKCLVALTIYRNNSNTSVDDFLRVISYVCGDDKIFGAPVDVNYNLLTVKKVAEDLGMTVTNGDKTPVTEPSRDLMKLNFLKRNIVYHPLLKRYVGALSISTLFNTLQWFNTDKVGESLTYDDLMRDKCNAVLVESYLHGRNCFLMFKKYMQDNDIEGLFEESQIVKILQDEEGYESVMDLLKKNFYN